MTEDQDAKDSQSEAGGKIFTNKNKDNKKSRWQRPLTKIVIRRLPPTMTEQTFLEQVSPIPEHDYFYFAKPDPSLGNSSYSRAYINFMNIDDIYLFRDKFDGYVFLDDKGIEYIGIVEYAPFQRISKKKKKKDPKCGTIESDPIFQEFLESLNEQETDGQPKLEYSYPVNDANDKKVTSTPLLDYLAARKLDKRCRDERRRRENDKRKMRIERKGKDGPIKEEENIIRDYEVKKVKAREWEKPKVAAREEPPPPMSPDIKDGAVFESKTFREQRKVSVIIEKKKKLELEKKELAKEEELNDDTDKNKKNKKEKFKDAPHDQKIKKYSDTRKERLRLSELAKLEKTQSKSTSPSGDKLSEHKITKTSDDDIKPFTQLPQIKTEDLSRAIDEMDRKMKLEENSEMNNKTNRSFEMSPDKTIKVKSTKKVVSQNVRRNSLDSSEIKEDSPMMRKNSLDNSSKSSDREDSVEKEKSDGSERPPERRIRNKDRPSLVIYQPGMGRFSKQRLAKETNTKSVNDAEKKDT